MENIEIINEEVLYSKGCFHRVRRWIRGWIPIPGAKYIQGQTGRETEIEIEIIKASKTFFVAPKE